MKQNMLEFINSWSSFLPPLLEFMRNLNLFVRLSSFILGYAYFLTYEYLCKKQKYFV